MRINREGVTASAFADVELAIPSDATISSASIINEEALIYAEMTIEDYYREFYGIVLIEIPVEQIRVLHGTLYAPSFTNTDE